MKDSHRIEHFLDERQVPYEVIGHLPTITSQHTAHAAHLEPARLAKGVLLEGDDCVLVAMVPADQDIRIEKLQMELGRSLRLADEATVKDVFGDCDPGTVPGLPMAWGVETVWDDALLAQPDLHLELGDHRHLIHLETRKLQMALEDMPHCRFGGPRHLH